MSLKRIIVIVLCVCLTTFAVSVSVDPDGYIALHAFTPGVYAAMAASAVVFWLAVGKKRIKPRGVSLALAIVLSLMTVVGLLLDGCHTLCVKGLYAPFADGTSIVFETRALTGLVLAMTGVGFALFYCACIELLYRWVTDTARLNGETASGWRARLYHYPMCCAILIIAWLPCIIAFFPGSFTSDESRQIAGFLGAGGVPLSNHAPYFCALVYGNLYSAGISIDQTGMLGTFFPLVMQILLSALVMSAFVIWLSKLGAPKWVPVTALAFFALFPLMAVRQVMLGYDTPHAALLALFVLQLVLFGVSRTRELDRSWLYHPAAIAFVGVLVALTRNNGIFLVMPSMVVLAIAYRSVLVGIMQACVLIVYASWQFVALPALGVAPGSIAEALSMPAQVVACQLSQSTDLTDQEREVLERYYVVPLDAIAAGYDPVIADPAKGPLTLNGAGDAAEYVKVSLSLGSRQLLSSLSAALCTTYGAWYPYCLGTFWHEFAPYVLDADNEWAVPSSWYAGADGLEARSSASSRVISLYCLASSTAPLSMLYAPGLYAWLLLVVGGFSLWSRSRRKLVLCALIPGIMLEAIMLAAPCASIRYAFPLVICLPLFLFLFVEIGASATKRH